MAGRQAQKNRVRPHRDAVAARKTCSAMQGLTACFSGDSTSGKAPCYVPTCKSELQTGAALLQTAVDHWAEHRLVGQLPPLGATIRLVALHLPRILSYRVLHDRLTEGFEIASSQSYGALSTSRGSPNPEAKSRLVREPAMPGLARSHWRPKQRKCSFPRSLRH